MTPAVAALVAAFSRDLDALLAEVRATARVDLLEEMREFSALPWRVKGVVVARRKKKRRPPKRRPRPPARKARRAPVPPPIPVIDLSDLDQDPVAGDPPKPQLVMVPVEPRPVIVRIDGKRTPKVALLVSESDDNSFMTIRLAQGRNRRYSPKSRRIIAAELLHNATDREAVLGVAFESWPPPGPTGC